MKRPWRSVLRVTRGLISGLSRPSTTRVIQNLAVMLGSAWAIYLFVWPEIVKPRFLEHPYLRVSSEMTEVARRSGHAVLKLKASADNVGKHEAYVLAAWFKVVGFRFGVTSPAQGCREAAEVRLSRQERTFRCEAYVVGNPNSVDAAGASSRTSRREIVAIGKLTDQTQRWRLPPGVNYTREALVHVPVTFDYVRLEVEFRFAREPDAVKLDWRSAADGSLDEVLTTPDGRALDLLSTDRTVQGRVNSFLVRNHVLKTFAISEHSLWPRSPLPAKQE
jgi:hypothetical protein